METLDSLRSGVDSGRLAGCMSLKLADGLREFPLEILSLAESLTFLNLSNNSLSHLPAEFSQLTKLKIVFFNNNNFEMFPWVLAQCPALSMVSFKANQINTLSAKALSPNLRWLTLTNNRLTSLPPTIGKQHRLQKLMLAGNRLTALPEELANCTSLELIRLSANRLTYLPDWLYQLPRLSWIAYAGNPFCQDDPATEISEPLPTIHESALQRCEALGEGASGIIYKGLWTPESAVVQTSETGFAAADSPQTVAIKIFKGEITSDGSPLDEMQACIAAGQHPNLVNVLGKVEAANETGLVFSLIPPDYRNLGGPPSLESCTRDTYKSDQSFTLLEILTVASGMASALAHLHGNRIVHGDFYAHNILINAVGHSILGDFGAASFYTDTGGDDRPEGSHPLEKIEARAFGCLLEDLLTRCSSSGNHEKAVLQQLQALQLRCMSIEPAERPAFSHIVMLLSKIA